MSLLYPRLIDIHRSKTNAGQSGISQAVGLVGYSGREQTTAASDPEGEIVLFTGICAGIAMQRVGRTAKGLLDADITNTGFWIITIPVSVLPQYSVRDRDIIIDDEKYRYQVAQNYYTAFGYQLECLRLET